MADSPNMPFRTAFCRHGTMLIAVGGNRSAGEGDLAYKGVVRIVDWSTGKIHCSATLPGVIFLSLAVSPIGEYLATGGDGTAVRMWTIPK